MSEVRKENMQSNSSTESVPLRRPDTTKRVVNPVMKRGVSKGDTLLAKHNQIATKEKEHSIDSAIAQLDRLIDVSTPLERQKKVVPVVSNETKVCKSWNTTGACPRGGSCKFEHPGTKFVISPEMAAWEEMAEAILAGRDMVDPAPPVVPVKEAVVPELSAKDLRLKALSVAEEDLARTKLINKTIVDSYGWREWFEDLVGPTPVHDIVGTTLCYIGTRFLISQTSNQPMALTWTYPALGIVLVRTKALVTDWWWSEVGSENEYYQTDSSTGFVSINRLLTPYARGGYSPLARLGGRSTEYVLYDKNMLEYLRLKEGVIRPTAFTINRFAQELQLVFAAGRSQKLIFDTARVYHQEMEFFRAQAGATTLCGVSLERL